MAVCLGAQGLAYWQTQASVPVATTAALLASTSLATVQAMYHRRRLAYPPTEAPAPPPSRLPFSPRNLRRRRAAS
ncbi:MAG: hypothetical protein AB1635_00285 [Acidobacteriota bacterium]